MNQLSVDTICLLFTCYLCKVLNMAMLDKIDGDEILLIAEDDVDCASAMRKKASAMSSKFWKTKMTKFQKQLILKE